MPIVPNPIWPTLFAEANFGSNTYFGVVGSSTYTDLTTRLYRGWSVRRGKQFELDQVQPGEWHGQWTNKDGFFDPANTGSYYYPNVLPFRGFRMRAQYPPSVNLLTGDQATGGQVSPLAVGATGPASGILNTYAVYTVTASGTAYQGSQVWQATGAMAPAGRNIFATTPIPVQAGYGTSYTFSIRARCVTAGANPVVKVGISWLDPSGTSVGSTSGVNVTLTGATSAAWTTFTFTATVPSAAFVPFPVSAQPFLFLVTAPGGTYSVQVGGIQFEQAAAATAFTIPGKSYPVYSGLVERYPQSWDYTGTYGVVSPICVDAMAVLSQSQLKEAFIMDVEALGPDWFYPLNDTSGATTFAENAGRFPPATLYSSGYGPGSVSPGAGITSAVPPVGQFKGTAGPVVTVNNNTGTPNQGTAINMSTAGITGLPGVGVGFTRMLAFRTASSNGTFMATTGGTFPTSSPGFFLSPTGTDIGATFFNAAGSSLGVVTAGVPITDNNWHLVFVSMDAAGTTIQITLDGFFTAINTGGVDVHPVGTINDSVGQDIYTTTSIVPGSTEADIALYAQWSYVLDDPTIQDLYLSWLTAWQGDTTGARYGRILRWANFQGPSSLDTGLTACGPATDIGGSDALTALQNLVDTESGRHFVAADGTLTFQSRAHLYQDVVSVATFGEDQAGGEIPYTDLAFDFDTTRISNTITITQVSTNMTFYARDSTSVTAYGERDLSRNNQAADTAECALSAEFYLSRYKDPHQRVQALTIDLASNPALFPAVLGLELGQRVTIKRRSVSGAPTITTGGFIEQITHTGDDQGAWSVDLQISPGPTTPYAVFTALRTTLSSSAGATTNVLNINPLPDAAVNNVRSNLTAGQLLILGPGTARQETVTIDVGGVSNSAAGYSSAVLILVSNTTFSHPSGEVVIESPGSTWDPQGTFGAVQFGY